MAQLKAAYRTMAYGATLAYHSTQIQTNPSKCEKQPSSSPSSDILNKSNHSTSQIEQTKQSISSTSSNKTRNTNNTNNTSNNTSTKYQFKSKSFDSEKSMSKGKVANLSCVDGFRSGSIEVGICVAQNMRAYQEDRWVSLIGKRRKAWNRLFDWGSSNSSHSSSSSSSRSKEGWFFGKKKNQVGSTEEISSIVDNLSIFAVFDGHGGSECSEFATQQFQHILEDEFAKARSMEQTNGNGSTTTTQVLENTLFEIDKQFIQQQRRQTGIAQDAFKSPNHGGSTAVVVAISPQDHKITCSNIGDSRAIIIKTPVAGGIKGSNYLPLSSDHSPNIRPDEVLRIEKLGGKVQSNAMESALAHTIGVKVCPRVYQPNGVGGLNMTRALGDDYLKPLVIPDPETFELTMDNDDLYVVLASDGIWDALSNEDVTRMITDMHKDQGKLLHPSILVRKSALMLVQRAQLKGCQDNITCMVIRLPTVGK